MDDNKLKEAFMKYNACPDCGGEEFREGPYGGMSRNVRCANCGHQFNWALPISIERIHITSNGIFR
jgi:DNA-directed RNA polymerase subunit RPC12/RpoP